MVKNFNCGVTEQQDAKEKKVIYSNFSTYKKSLYLIKYSKWPPLIFLTANLHKLCNFCKKIIFDQKSFHLVYNMPLVMLIGVLKHIGQFGGS